jgi:hypothetical protein
MAGVAALASGGAGAAGPGGAAGERVDRLGQARDPEAHGLHEDDQVFDRDRAQSRVSTSTRSAAVDGPTARPLGAWHPGYLLHSASEWRRRRGGQAQEPKDPGRTDAAETGRGRETMGARKGAFRMHPLAGLPGSSSKSSRQAGAERQAQG